MPTLSFKSSKKVYDNEFEHSDQILKTVKLKFINYTNVLLAKHLNAAEFPN